MMVSNSRAELEPMEPFTLIIWLWMGARFEQTQVLNLGRSECIIGS